MTPIPPWAVRSALWGSNSAADTELTAAEEHKLHINHFVDQRSATDKHYPVLEDMERKIALKVFEGRDKAAHPVVDVFAFEQVISSSLEVVESTQIGNCIAIIFNRERALNNSFEITAEHLPFQLELFLKCAYTSSGKLLSSLVEPASNPFDEQSSESASATDNHALIGEHSFVLIEGIRVDAPHRRRGIGRKMLAAVLKDAQQMLPDVRFAVSWPCAHDGDLADMNFPAGASIPHGVGQQRAEDFHHGVGFRKLGLTRFWAMALSS